jgi:hypothetical protein
MFCIVLLEIVEGATTPRVKYSPSRILVVEFVHAEPPHCGDEPPI